MAVRILCAGAEGRGRSRKKQVLFLRRLLLVQLLIRAERGGGEIIFMFADTAGHRRERKRRCAAEFENLTVFRLIGNPT